VSGVEDVTVLNTTGSEFHGFHRDRYTTLAETNDRVLATAVTARWRHASDGSDWGKSFRRAHMHLLAAFADTHSLSLQQTLHAMGERVLREGDELVEARLSLPNKHHFLVDLSPFQLDNPGEVFFAADRPYGLIEGTVLRDGAPEPGLAWW
jgi:urate oxidase